jgi:hypothetical protein
MNGNKLAGGAIVLTAMLCNSFSAVAQGQPAAQEPKPLYLDASQPIDRRIDDLMGRMQLTENCNAYFTPEAMSDFASSLAPLGAPLSFTQSQEEGVEA